MASSRYWALQSTSDLESDALGQAFGDAIVVHTLDRLGRTVGAVEECAS